MRAKRRKKNDGEVGNNSDGNGDVEESLLAEGKEFEDNNVVILESEPEASQRSRPHRKIACRPNYNSNGAVDS